MCEYNNRGRGGAGVGGGGGCRVKLDKLGGAHVLKGWKPLVYAVNQNHMNLTVHILSSKFAVGKI